MEVLGLRSDIQYNLPILNYFAKQCRHITEMGVRAMVSTWALLDGVQSGGTVVGIDIVDPKQYGVDVNEVVMGCGNDGILFKFIQEDTLKMEIAPTDMLFIDTIHTKEQLSKELELHGDKVRKFIAFHDTVSCPELLEVINQFVQKNKNWVLAFQGVLSSGLVVIQKI